MKEKHQSSLPQKYNKAVIFIHWFTALSIIILFPLGKYMEGLAPMDKLALIKIHVILGLIMFGLTIVRSWLYFRSPRPAQLKTGSTLNDTLLNWIHHAFYFILIAIALSGISTMVVGGYLDVLTNSSNIVLPGKGEVPALKAHGFLAIIMMLLFVVHVAGVIKHYIMLGENALRRIS